MWCSSSSPWQAPATPSTSRTTRPRPSGRRGPPSGCSTSVTHGAPPFRRRTWPPPWLPRCARCATGGGHGLLLTPLTVGLVLSVVYGQFHYAVDAVAGLIVACAVLASQYIYASQPAPVAAALPGRELEAGRA